MTTEKANLLRLATYASVATASLLIVAKLWAWLATGSVSIMATLVDSLMDVGASVINLLAVRYSLMPADDEHRFGHGKAEALAGLGQAAFIVGSALFLLLEASDRLINPQPIEHIEVGMGVMLFSMLSTLLLLALQRHVVKRTGSTAIRADALHYATDLATNGATLLALFLATRGLSGLDPLFAIGIAVYILYSAAQIAREAIRLLMDHELPRAEREAIKAMALATPGVLGVHGLRTWQTGQRKVVQMHLELDGQLSLYDAHHIAVEVERRLRKDDPLMDINIHQDPSGLGKEGKHSFADELP